MTSSLKDARLHSRDLSAVEEAVDIFREQVSTVFQNHFSTEKYTKRSREYQN